MRASTLKLAVTFHTNNLRLHNHYQKSANAIPQKNQPYIFFCQREYAIHFSTIPVCRGIRTENNVTYIKTQDDVTTFVLNLPSLANTNAQQ